MKKQYNQIVNENTGEIVYWYIENGCKYSFIADPSNSDYQQYLAAQSTPIVTEDE
jgi:hypothetical protein